MGRAVLLSIQPKWCELIASGKKTVEVRKTKPKLETPFKCYIYETKDAHFEHIGVHYADGQDFIHHIGKVIGEFVCGRIDRIGKRGGNNNFDYCYLPLVWGNDDIEVEITDIRKSRIAIDDLNRYGALSACLYAWHISDLKIYDEPKDLNEFYPYCKGECAGCKYLEWIEMYGSDACTRKRIKRPPQSWCYVEALDE